MKTAVIYARYSCDNQTEQSIEGQLRVCQDYAARNDIAIVDTYIDRAMTGTNDNRPDFRRMIKDSARHKWNYVLVYKLDRFSRDRYAAAIHKHTLKENGVKLLSAMENIPDTPEGIILESLLEGMNQYYSAELSQKVKRGMNETRQKGNFTGGTLIYGYKVIDHKIHINEEQAEIVRFIYSQFANGVYVKDIIAQLNGKGIYNHGKPFAKNTIYNILKNEKYSGIFRHGEEVFENMYPRIVDKDIYDRVRAKTAQNKYGSRSVEVVYLLRNKMKCGYCGMPISAETGTSKTGKKIRYYKCLGRKRRNGCQKSMVRKEFLEDFIIDGTLELLATPALVNKIVKGVLTIQEELNKQPPIINILNQEKRQAEKALTNIMTAIEKGVVSNTTNKRLHELESKIEDIDRRLLIEQSKTIPKLSESEIKEFYTTALESEPLLLINYLIKEIVLYDDRVEIHYNNPILTSPETEIRGFLFYSETRYLKYIIQNKATIQRQKMTVEWYVG